MKTRDALICEIETLVTLPHTDKNILTVMKKVLTSTDSLLRQDNPKNHFCSFFLPLCRTCQFVYLVHHKKAGLWIPPGGHIDSGETPRQTVTREFEEELGRKVMDSQITLSDCSITEIEHPKTCFIHYDIWYLVEFNIRHRFRYSKYEFYDAGWMHIDEAIRVTDRAVCQSVLQNLKGRL